MKKPSKELKDFGKIIRSLRLKAILTQEELSEKIGCHPNHVGRLERGQTEPSFSMLVKLARALKVSIRQIMPE